MATTGVIRHGRRKGGTRSADSGEELRPSQVVVVPSYEWQRIRDSLHEAERQQARAKAQQEAKLERHTRSKAIVSQWENTIEGQRIKRLQARRIREEKEEAERVKVDIEEAAFQAQQRKEAIENAKTLLYYQTDRVKQFHGALMLSEVLRERDKQIEFKKKKEERVKDTDQHYLKLQEEEREKSTLADMKAAEIRAKEREVVAKFQIVQCREAESKRREVREEALSEQRKLDKEMEEFSASQRKLEESQLQKRRAYRDDLDQVLAGKQTMEQTRWCKEEKEDKERKIFAQAKRKMVQMRKIKEEELFQEFQQQQERMCDKLREQMSQKVSDEDQKIARAVAEREAMREYEEREKSEKFAAKTRDIFCHRHAMIVAKQQKDKEMAELDQELLKQRVIQDQKFHAQQFDKHQKATQEACEVQNFHKTQMVEANLRKSREKNEEKEYNAHNTKLHQVEEQQFQQYAQSVIDEAQQRGSHTYPLKKAALTGAGGGHGPVFTGKGGIRPSYQTMDATGVELPSYHPTLTQTGRNTQRRMGFTW